MFRKRVRFTVSISVLIVLALCLLVTALLFATIRRIEYQKHSTDFILSANLRLAAVNEGLKDAIGDLLAVNQLFIAVGSVSRAQFHVFTEPLLRRHPYIQAFSFQRLISAGERAGYEAEVRKHYPGFTITEAVAGKLTVAGKRDSYHVVDYIEPMAGNEKAFGLDTSFSSDKTSARQHSRDTGLTSITGMLQLVQGKDPSGFMILMPVYRRGEALGNVDARRRAVVGETAAIFKISNLLEKILASGGFLKATGMDINVYVGDATDDSALAFRFGSPPSSVQPATLLPQWLFYDHADNVAKTFEMAGKPLHMVISDRAVVFTSYHHGSLYVLIGGMLFSLMAGAYVYTLVSSAARAEKLVADRTTALQLTNFRLTEDIAAHVHTENLLKLQGRVIEISANAIVIASAALPDYRIEYVNPAFERLTGYLAADVVGKPLQILQGDERDQQNSEEIRAALRESREGHATLRNYRKDGTPYWSDVYITPVKNKSDEISHFVLAQYDVTAAKRYEAELEFQANHDVLTGLANRNLLRDRLHQAFAYADRFQQPIWVVFVDLDRFKFVNDTLGHEAGDNLLKIIADRMQSAVRDVDTLARLGGDEFVLILRGNFEDGLGIRVVQRIMDAVAQPLIVNEHTFFLTCSIGLAVYPIDGVDADTLLKHADIAMYRAKEIGRNNFQFYTPAMNEMNLDRLRLESDLRNALDRGELVLHYQPQVNLETGRVVGMEALIRWQHPILGMLMPSRFIGLAEETGLIIPIGIWVIRTACEQNRAWQLAGLGHLRVAVNLSSRQFAQHDLVESIAAVLNKTGLAPQYLEIELTESLIMTDVERAIGILRGLKALGVQLSVDDFGTGYSSLSYLKRFPIDVLKIDQSFVRDITDDLDDAAIVFSIISLAHSLRLHVIAEGVETAEQLSYLQQHGCDDMQGYLFNRPVPHQEFEKLLLEGRCLPRAADQLSAAIDHA